MDSNYIDSFIEELERILSLPYDFDPQYLDKIKNIMADKKIELYITKELSKFKEIFDYCYKEDKKLNGFMLATAAVYLGALIGYCARISEEKDEFPELKEILETFNIEDSQ